MFVIYLLGLTTTTPMSVKNIATALSITFVLLGCRQGAPEPPAAAPAPSETQADAAPAVSPSTEAATRHLEAIKIKGSCNRLMGCEPALALLQMGPAVVGGLLDALAAQALDGRYWQVRLITLLGQASSAALDGLQDWFRLY